jgi:hypothetical protein
MQTTLIYLTSAAVATVGASYAAVPLYRSAINQHLRIFIPVRRLIPEFTKAYFTGQAVSRIWFFNSLIQLRLVGDSGSLIRNQTQRLLMSPGEVSSLPGLQNMTFHFFEGAIFPFLDPEHNTA